MRRLCPYAVTEVENADGSMKKLLIVVKIVLIVLVLYIFSSCIMDRKTTFYIKNSYVKAKAKDNSITNEMETWPQSLRQEWEKVEKSIPMEAFNEANEEANMYMEKYIKTGFPMWLDDGME